MWEKQNDKMDYNINLKIPSVYFQVYWRKIISYEMNEP
jgi:hypothetical protein